MSRRPMTDAELDQQIADLGLTEPTPTVRRLPPGFDRDRILGQIDRGEIRTGADAAREIAARHEAAYGDVWTRRDTQAVA